MKVATTPGNTPGASAGGNRGKAVALRGMGKLQHKAMSVPICIIKLACDRVRAIPVGCSCGRLGHVNRGVGLMSMLASFFGFFYGFGVGRWHLYYPGSGVKLTFRLKVVAPSR